MACGQRPLRHSLAQMPPPHLWPMPKLERTPLSVCFLRRLARRSKIPERILDDEIAHVRFGSMHFIALAVSRRISGSAIENVGCAPLCRGH